MENIQKKRDICFLVASVLFVVCVAVYLVPDFQLPYFQLILVLAAICLAVHYALVPLMEASKEVDQDDSPEVVLQNILDVLDRWAQKQEQEQAQHMDMDMDPEDDPTRNNNNNNNNKYNNAAPSDRDNKDLQDEPDESMWDTLRQLTKPYAEDEDDPDEKHTQGRENK